MVADVEMWKGLVNTGRMAYSQGDYRQAHKQFTRALEMAQHKGLTGPFVVEPRVELAVCLSAQRQYDEAEKLLRQALVEAQSQAGPAMQADCYHELSVLLWRTGRDAESEQMNQSALDSLAHSQADLPELRANILKHRSVLLTARKQFREAGEYLDQAATVVLDSPEFGKESLLYAQVLITRALLCVEMKRFDDARDYYQRSINLIEMGWGAHHPKVADLYEIIAQHTKGLANSQVSEQFDEKARQLREWIKSHHGW